jgi:PEP-CTERM motif
MKKLALTIIATVAIWSTQASAALYHFEFHSVAGPVTSVIGVTETVEFFNANPPLSVNIIGVTGTVTGPGGGAITSLVLNPNQPLPALHLGFDYDNLGYPVVPYVDQYGVLFQANGFLYRLYSQPNSFFYYLSSNNPAAALSTGTFTTALITPVPEPSTWALMIAGFVALVGLARFRRSGRQSAIAA